MPSNEKLRRRKRGGQVERFRAAEEARLREESGNPALRVKTSVRHYLDRHGFDDTTFSMPSYIPYELEHWFMLPQHGRLSDQVLELSERLRTLSLPPLEEILMAPPGSTTESFALRSSNPTLTGSPYHIIRFQALVPESHCQHISALFNDLESLNPFKHIPRVHTRHNGDVHTEINIITLSTLA